jgi:hypothetical protein
MRVVGEEGEESDKGEEVVEVEAPVVLGVWEGGRQVGRALGADGTEIIVIVLCCFG